MTTTETKTERPILFSGAMIKAILSGAKTQTRRIMKLQPKLVGGRWIYGVFSIASGDKPGPWCPYGEVGDRLWVRETWAAHWMYNDVPPSKVRSGLSGDNYWYAADPDGSAGSCGCPSAGRIGRWRPSIHMPRWASRLLLQIESVKVERLRDISEEDAIAEGVGERDNTITYPQTAFANLWDKINGKRANWESNPWVWVVSFKRVEVSP